MIKHFRTAHFSHTSFTLLTSFHFISFIAFVVLHFSPGCIDIFSFHFISFHFIGSMLENYPIPIRGVKSFLLSSLQIHFFVEKNHGADTFLDEVYSRGRYFSQYCDISLDRKIHGADTSFD